MDFIKTEILRPLPPTCVQFKCMKETVDDLPIFPVLAGYMALVTLPFHLADRKKVKEEGEGVS